MDLQEFDFEGQDVRIVGEPQEPWFVAKDVCQILGLRNASDTVAKLLEPDEKGVENIYTPGGNQNFTVVNEPGLYNLVFRSNKPEAKRFKRWITHRVIPAIRSHGGYLTPEKTEEILTDPDNIIRLAQDLKDERNRRQIAEKRNEELDEHNRELQPKAQYAEEVLISESLIPSSIIAKELGVGAQTLHNFLWRRGVIYKRGKTWYLYHRYQNRDIADYDTFKQVIGQDDFGNDVIRTHHHLKWTEQGRKMIHRMWERSKSTGEGSVNKQKGNGRYQL